MLYTIVMETNYATFGIYRSRDQLQKTVERLTSQGFDPTKVKIMLPENFGQQDFAYELRMMVRPGAVIGASIGMAVGALVGFFVLTAVAYAFIGALFGSIFGAAAGALVGIGTPEKPGLRYLRYLKDGGFLLSVHVDGADENVNAFKIMESTGGEDIVTTDEAKAWIEVIEKTKRTRPVRLVQSPSKTVR